MDERDSTTLGDMRGLLSWHYGGNRSICTRNYLGSLDPYSAS
jgi:hypothetical protein